MSNKIKAELTDIEAISMIVGFMIGSGILSLPSGLVKYTKQLSWVAAALGIIYPLTFLLLFNYIKIKKPNSTIFSLSRECFGNFIGNVLNIIFSFQFFVYIFSMCISIGNIYRVYASDFLSNIQIYIVLILIALYCVNSGFENLAKINKVVLFLVVMIPIVLGASLFKGRFINILPLFNFKNLDFIGAFKESLPAYGGFEAIFLVYPFMQQKQNFNKCAIKAIFIVGAIYTWIVFVSIYCLGYKMVGKSLWPVLLVTESLSIPILNSFRLVFIFLWSGIVFKSIANHFYYLLFIIKDTFNIKNEKLIYIFLFPLDIYISTLIKNEVQKGKIVNFIIQRYVLYNYIYLILIIAIIFIKTKIKKFS